MSDINNDIKASSTTRIVGNDELFAADIAKSQDGINRLKVDSEVSPKSIGGLFIDSFSNNGSTALNINASGAPVEFTIPLKNEDTAISSISIYGRDNGIQFGQFLAINQTITGIIFEIKSDDNVFSSPPITITDDFRNKFCISPRDFVIDVFSNEDVFTAAFVSPSPIIIRGQNTFTTPDYIKVTIRDNISQVNYLEASVFGATL